jgi:hypothetical protein
MIGPGKYDDLATRAREAAEAGAVILIVLDGNKGSGFSMQAHGMIMTEGLPMLLRRLADDIEQDLGGT